MSGIRDNIFGISRREKRGLIAEEVEAMIAAAIAAIPAPATPISSGPSDRAYIDGGDQAAVAVGAAALAAHVADPDPHVGYQLRDATLTALAAADWALDAVPVGTGANTLTQLALAANTFIGKSSAGAVAAKAITDAALAALANMTVETAFTPVVIGSTTAGLGTYTVQSGSYTRSGNVVHFKLIVTITGHTGTGNIRVDGLPFVAANTGNTPVHIGQVDNMTTPAGTIPLAEVVANTTQIRILSLATGGGVSAGVAMDTAFTLAIAGSYFA